jgi:ParB-like chromosome segregation protein Spo0J
VAGAEAGPGASGRKIVAVPILALRPGDSPRSGGEDKAHIARLAEAETPLPPILVERRTMRVIDGMHRFLAASLRGQETVDVEFFDGKPEDAFLCAVEANVTHGLPLSLADRRAAAERIIASHPQMSDRAIGRTTGLAARTVAAIRRSSGDGGLQLNARVGRDGRVRPLSSAEGRRRAAALLAEHPGASLREVARGAGVSPATARDVRRRLERGEEPVPARPGAVDTDDAAEPGLGGRPERREPAPPDPAAVEKLLRDPSLRHNEQGRRLLRVLQVNAVEAHEWTCVIAAVPPHCTSIVVQVARQYAQMWYMVAQDLDKRAQIMEPLRRVRMNGRNLAADVISR